MDTATKVCRGLVLAGGGARGSYQIGVWRALDELGWTAGAVTGTSVGCLNGAMYALGQYETARDMWLTIHSGDVMELPDPAAGPRALGEVVRQIVAEAGWTSPRWRGLWPGCWTRRRCGLRRSGSGW